MFYLKIWFFILVYLCFVPSAIIGGIFSFCYRKNKSKLACLVLPSLIAPILTSLYFALMDFIMFYNSDFRPILTLYDYLFLIGVSALLTLVIAALRLALPQIKVKMHVAFLVISDLLFFILLSTTMALGIFFFMASLLSL